MSNTLSISEDFYSCQAEGHTSGYPAYFIRLKSCNLSCGLSKQHLSKIFKAGKGSTDSGTFIGDLHKEGKATWTCDTAPIWLFGEDISYEILVEKWVNAGLLEWISQKRVHLIWTGGEPSKLNNQKDIVGFLDWIGKTYSIEPYNEIETNGTIYIEDSLFNHLDQINCSVKLANSGMDKGRRINPRALNRIMSHHNYWFKFVVSVEDDIKEIEEDFIKPFSIPFDRVIMMPGLDSQENFHERTAFVLEMAKKYGYIGLTRLHVSAWNRTTGV